MTKIDEAVRENLDQLREMINRADHIAVISHLRPDGDAAGSVIGLGLVLEDAGKKVQMVLEDGIPSSAKHLTSSSRVQKAIENEPDLIIVVDSADLARIGNSILAQRVPDINIDHHPTNQKFAKINLIEESAVSATEILTKLIPALGLTISPEAAQALLTGLVTDSLGFQTPNMDAEAMLTATELIEAGADLPEIYYQSLTRRSFEAARLWGIGLNNLKRENGLIWTRISLAERRSVGYNGHDDAELVNMLPSIEGSQIAMIFLEQPDERVKISWRSRSGYDISKLAFRYGGGGHENAAGAMLPGKLEEVQEHILQETRNYIKTLNQNERNPEFSF